MTESSISLASDYLRGWCEFPGPITDDNEAKVSILACLKATQTGCVLFDRKTSQTFFKYVHFPVAAWVNCGSC